MHDFSLLNQFNKEVGTVCVGVTDSVAGLVDLNVLVDFADQCTMLARVFQSQDISCFSQLATSKLRISKVI